MNEYYTVCKEDLDKENTVIKIHRGTKLENSDNTIYTGLPITLD
jgi:hypothetical protein